jgi:glutamyl-tRNA reductase
MEITMEQLSKNETASFERAMDAQAAVHDAQAVREELNRLALTDLNRKRAKLGSLNQEQERAVEALFLSTIARIPAPALLHLRRTRTNQPV